jgi:hypothetical protein
MGQHFSLKKCPYHPIPRTTPLPLTFSSITILSLFPFSELIHFPFSIFQTSLDFQVWRLF